MARKANKVQQRKLRVQETIRKRQEAKNNSHISMEIVNGFYGNQGALTDDECFKLTGHHLKEHNYD